MVIIGLGVVGVMVRVSSVCGVQSRDSWAIPCFPLIISLLFFTNPSVSRANFACPYFFACGLPAR
jgi:hypothetical protein